MVQCDQCEHCGEEQRASEERHEKVPRIWDLLDVKSPGDIQIVVSGRKASLVLMGLESR